VELFITDGSHCTVCCIQSIFKLIPAFGWYMFPRKSINIASKPSQSNACMHTHNLWHLTAHSLPTFSRKCYSLRHKEVFPSIHLSVQKDDFVSKTPHRWSKTSGCASASRRDPAQPSGLCFPSSKREIFCSELF